MEKTSPTQVTDQRRAWREELEAPVTLRIEATRVEGVSDNLSEVGIMLFTDVPVRCVVEVGHGEDARRYHGRLVRLQRMNETNTGLAIEFDTD